MPGGDGTGPLGFGPATGRALGYCAGYRQAGYASPGFGRGWFGRGRGRGRGFYARPALDFWQNYQPQISDKEEMDALKSEADVVKDELKSIEARIQELKGSKSKK